MPVVATMVRLALSPILRRRGHSEQVLAVLKGKELREKDIAQEVKKRFQVTIRPRRIASVLNDLLLEEKITFRSGRSAPLAGKDRWLYRIKEPPN